jgi:beta-lactam-binding protein with PASTA domain/tRNA A-37 threonylcarbamoyl transferase component Bud32
MIGRLIDGRYQVRSRIARGGMATVYLATDLRLERRVAIKIMHGHLADDSQFKERFIQEARSAARLAHPNVVNVFDQGQDSDMAYLVMEYLSGITLRDLLTEHKVLTPEQTLDILEAVLSGLAAAHKSGIVHRDLKPENVLLADDGRIKIGDFGLARAASANTATGAALLGTIAYLSPELVTRGIADARSDIYAVGIMMYEMLAGEQPFRGEQPMQIAYQHANDSVPTPSTRNPDVPAELDELVLWATAREPDQRPRDARMMLEQVVETQNQLRTALPTGATSVIQRTTVLPAALALSGTGDQTQVIRPPKATGPVAPVSEATAALTAATNRRHSRAWWWVVLLIIVAGLAGGTGWYFGAGPGSQVTIPEEGLVGQSPEAARALITELGLPLAEQDVQVFDPLVAVGAVAGTDPAVGTSVSRATVVTLQVSKGPQPIAVPEFTGLAEQDAKALAEATGFVTTDSEQRFSADVAAGVVLESYGVDDAQARVTLVTGENYFDQRPVTFLVSAGPLPGVAGLTVAEAQAKLDAVGLTGVPLEPVFDNTVPDGQVIALQPTAADAPIAPGDSVELIVSKGPDLVEIPDVVGEKLPDARAMLEEAGFTVRVVTNVPGPFQSQAEVQSIRPGDESALRGSEITIVSNY